MTGPAARSTPLLLGIDAGSSRIKVLLLEADGGEAGVSAAATPFAEREGRVEASVEAIIEAVAAALRPLGDRLDRVEAVGVCGLAESGAPLDAGGAALAPVIAWHDPRGQAVVDRLLTRFGPELALRTGQRPRTVSSAAKLGWLVAHGCAPVRRWLGVPELVVHALTGVAATEDSLAARTGWYDIGTRAWMAEVAAACGLEAGALVDVRPAGAELGRLSRQGRVWSGLPEGVAVTLAGHDHLAGARGVVAAEDELVNSTGTAETVLARVAARPDVATALERGLAVSLFPGGGHAVLSGAARAGMVLGRAAALLDRDADRLLAPEPPPGVSVSALLVAGHALLGALERGQVPSLIAGLPPGFAGAALIEALAERTAQAVDRLQPFTGAPRALLVTGGGARSPASVAAKARRCAPPVLVPETAEAAARGAAVAAGLAAGCWARWEDAPRPPRRTA